MEGATGVDREVSLDIACRVFDDFLLKAFPDIEGRDRKRESA